MRRRFTEGIEKKIYLKRFYPAGTYTWTVPNGCEELDLFLVGGGAGGGNGYGSDVGSGSGYTKTYKSSNISSGSYNDWIKDGDSIKVNPGDIVKITVGAGGIGGVTTNGRNAVYGSDGGSTSVTINGVTYIAEGGKSYKGETDSTGYRIGGSGGVGGTEAGGWGNASQACYSDGNQPPRRSTTSHFPGTSQGHTTRDFGDIEYSPNSGGTSGHRGSRGSESPDKSTGHIEGSGVDGTDHTYNSNTYPYSKGGAGYGGAGGSGGISENSGIPHGSGAGGKGGDGTVVIRYYSYEG